jgi:hypothetical protein
MAMNDTIRPGTYAKRATITIAPTEPTSVRRSRSQGSDTHTAAPTQSTATTTDKMNFAATGT